MKPNYTYQGKARKEVWLSSTTIKKLQKQAIAEKRTLKAHMEYLLEKAANSV